VFSAGNRSFQLSPFDPDYQGFHLIIWRGPTGGGACDGSHYGYLVQRVVDAQLSDWGCRIQIVQKRDAEIPGCPGQLSIVRFSPNKAPDLTASEVYDRLVAAYKQAIDAQDQVVG
jgi:hypothetical protein